MTMESNNTVVIRLGRNLPLTGNRRRAGVGGGVLGRGTVPLSSQEGAWFQGYNRGIQITLQ